MSSPFRPLVQGILAGILVCQSTGCTGWHTVPEAGAAALVEQRHPDRVRLRLRSGEQLVLQDPAAAGDTILGVVHRDTARIADGDVTSVAVRRFSPGRTVLLTLGIAGLTVGIACVLACGFGTVGLGY